MTPGRALLLLLLPLIAAVEATGSFGAMSLDFMMRSDVYGLVPEDLWFSPWTLEWFGVAGLVLGLGLAAGIGGRWTLVAGLLVQAVALYPALLGLFPSGSAVVPLLSGASAVLEVGEGLTRIGLWTAALEPFAGELRNLRHVALVLTYVGREVGALVSGLWASLYGALGAVWTGGGLVAVMVLALLLAVGLAVGQHLLRDEEPEVSRELDGRRVGVGAGVLLLYALAIPALSASWMPGSVDDWQVMRWLVHINPVVVLLGGLLLAVAFGVAQALRRPLPELFLPGLGALVVGVATLISLVPGGVPIVVVVMVVGAIGEVLLLVGVSAGAGGQHRRVVPVLLGFGFLVRDVLSHVLSVLTGVLPPVVRVGGQGVLAIVAGLVLLGVAWPVYAWLVRPLAAEPEVG